MRTAVLRHTEDDGARVAVCPAEFATTDRLMQRWAVSIGMGLQSDKWQDIPLKSRPPPLDDHAAIIMDQIVMKSQPRIKTFFLKWYRTNLPCSEIADQMRLTDLTLITLWHMSLLFTQKRILDSGDKYLLAQLRFRE